jgi:hypothetical protein
MSPRMEIKVGAKPSGELQDEAPSQRRKPDTEHFRLPKRQVWKSRRTIRSFRCRCTTRLRG